MKTTIKEFLTPYLEVVTRENVLVGEVSISKLKDGYFLDVIETIELSNPDWIGLDRNVGYLDDKYLGVTYCGEIDTEPINNDYTLLLTERLRVNGKECVDEFGETYHLGEYVNVITKMLDLKTMELKEVYIIN